MKIKSVIFLAVAAVVFSMVVFSMVLIYQISRTGLRGRDISIYFPNARTVEPHPYRNEVIILTFHDISSTDKSHYAITPQMFETEIKDIVDNGYHVIPLQQAVNFSQNKGTIPPKAVVITTDDGYTGMYKYAYPVLKKYRIPATFFLVAGIIGHNPNMLTWSQIKEMEASGLITYGGHTYNSHREVLVSSKVLEPATIAHIYDSHTHHTENQTEYYKRMFNDSIQAQKMFIQQLGHPTPFFAYPYGAYTPEFDGVLRDAGYKYFFTEIPGVLNKRHHSSQFYRLDIGMPNLLPTEMFNEIHQWSEAINPNNNTPPRYIIRWKV